MDDKTLNELKSILLSHARKYPQMQPTDAVKLIYQNEFGGGHMIRSEKACLDYLMAEYSATPKALGELREDIGNGLVRINLSALDDGGITPEQLGTVFIESASAISGNMGSFKKKLNALTSLAEEGIFAFSADELRAYLDEYASHGYPAVSHSEVYRELYKPAYRIVLFGLLNKHLKKEHTPCNL